jgi:hypothetical protein
MAEPKPDITPAIKIGELLEHFPELEAVLIAHAPPFRKLRNPVLRRTVARVTTLAQAARVGGVSVGELVAVLRQAAGLAPVTVFDESSRSGSQAGGADWPDTLRVHQCFDAREMIERGEHPLGKVLIDLRALPDNAVYELTTSFEPAPLIDKARGLGFDVRVRQETPALFRTYFRRSPV